MKDKLGSISGMLLCCVGIAVAAGVPSGARMRSVGDGPAPGKRVVRKAADLPPFTYPLTGTAQALLDSDDATFNAFAGKVRNDLESVLRDDDIQDKSVLLHLLSDRLDLQMLAGNDVDALKTCEQMRLLSDQPAMKATGMFNDITFLKARMTTGHSAGKAFQAEYEKNFRAQVDSLPWEVVAERIKKRRADFERLSVEYVASKVRVDIEPFVSEHHALDFPMATRLIFWRGVVMTELPQRQIVLDVLSTYIKEHDAPRPPAARIRPVTDDYFGTARLGQDSDNRVGGQTQPVETISLSPGSAWFPSSRGSEIPSTPYLSKYEGAGESPDVARVKEDIRNGA